MSTTYVVEFSPCANIFALFAPTRFVYFESGTTTVAAVVAMCLSRRSFEVAVVF